MVSNAALWDRAGELKGELVEFSRQPTYDRAASLFLAEYGDGSEEFDEQRFILLWDTFVLEYEMADGRTVVEQFVAAKPELSEAEREMVLGWRDVVQGPFEVLRRDGPALVVESLVDDLTYRVRSTSGPGVFRQVPRRSFIIARLIAVGDEWMLSGPTSVLPSSEQDVAFQMAMDMALQVPEAVFRNPEKLARAWEHQHAGRDRFMRFFDADLVVLSGDQAQERLDAYHRFCHAELGGSEQGHLMELPPDLIESDTIALIYDETDGLGFYADFGLVAEAFANPDLLRRRRWREQVLCYLHDDTIEPMVLRRLAERDTEKASTVFRRLLKRPRFDWSRDGEKLLRELRPDYFAHPPRPAVSPVSDRLAAFISGQAPSASRK